jgi:ribosomal protein S18 acetylase RimI-like enzyme
MNCRVVPIAEEHIAGFHETTGRVFREARMHALLEAPPIEQVAAFVRGNIRGDELQFVALHGEGVIGWCDILTKPRVALRHSGVLGIGVLNEYRGQGVGKALMETTLAAARARGITRIELTVRTDNERGKRL